jgi:hypothetical protein
MTPQAKAAQEWRNLSHQIVAHMGDTDPDPMLLLRCERLGMSIAPALYRAASAGDTRALQQMMTLVESLAPATTCPVCKASR